VGCSIVGAGMNGRKAMREERKPSRENRRDACSTRRRKDTGGTPAPLPGREGGPQNMRFCETKPIVMLGKLHLYGLWRRSWIDYRKMTNGFVFSGRGRELTERRLGGTVGADDNGVSSDSAPSNSAFSRGKRRGRETGAEWARAGAMRPGTAVNNRGYNGRTTARGPRALQSASWCVASGWRGAFFDKL
jgi:hypothetical protein